MIRYIWIFGLQLHRNNKFTLANGSLVIDHNHEIFRIYLLLSIRALRLSSDN